MNFRDHVNKILSASTTEFGEEVKFFPSTGGAFPVRAIFNNEYEALDLDTQRVVSDNQPNLGINLNDFSFEVIAKKTEVEVRGIRYTIQDKREDGQGGALLMLHRKNKNERMPDTKAT